MRFEWKNYDEFRAKFDARKLAYEPLKKAVTTAAILVQGEARNLAPSDTGLLRRSIAFEFVDAWPVLTGRVGTSLRHAPFMESGTGLMNDGGIPGGSGKRHWPPGHALDDWAKRHGFESGAQVARIIGRRGGIPPSGARLRRPYLRTALANQEERIRATLEAAQREIQQKWDAP